MVGCWRGFCVERGADLHMAQLIPLPLTVSCFSKIQIGFTFLVPAHPGSPGTRAVKRVCVCVTAVLIIKNATVSKSQNVKDWRANKYPRKIKVNLRTKVGICISTYLNADVVCYITATWRTELNEVCLINLTKNHFKLVVGHTTKQMKHGRLCSLMRHLQPRFIIFECCTHYHTSSV